MADTVPVITGEVTLSEGDLHYWRALTHDTMETFYREETRGRVSSLTDGRLATSEIVDAVGSPAYVSDPSEWEAYGITEPGWYVFARIESKYDDELVTASTTVEGAAGYIAEIGANHIDVAVKFEVAAMSQVVVINWGNRSDTFVFRAPDLATRNLDYRVTFYVYDIDEFVTWSYKPASDETFIEDKKYFVKDGEEFSLVDVEAGEKLPLYYIKNPPVYVLTTDALFVEDISYYTRREEYDPAEVTAGEVVTANTYYVYVDGAYVLTEDTEFVEGAEYYVRKYEYDPAEVTAGEVVTANTYYVQAPDTYSLPEEEEFLEDTEYYVKVDVYTLAEVTAGNPVAANIYYVSTGDGYELTEDTEFVDGTEYYTKSIAYELADVTVGDPAYVYYVHAKVRFEGMTRNITYRFNEIIDCPVEFVLPEIEDECHGAWFEIRLRHDGSYSSTLIPPSDDIKIATEHTQAETKGLNMVDLHYSSVGGAKVWRFMNTHSTIPAPATT